MNSALGHRARTGFALSVVVLAASVFVAAPAVDAGLSPGPVDLGAADPFVILAGTAITDVPPSVITGDVGLSPGTGAGIGVTCDEVTGTIYSVDAAGPLPCRVTDPALLTMAKNDFTAAFIDLAGRIPAPPVPVELGGTTKTAGVYTSAATTFGITAGAGPLVLDAEGDPDAVFIFQMAADGTGLTVGPGAEVQLVNGAQACNVWWQLTSATIDTTAVFKGNILAAASITVNTGADVEGRLLAQAQVSLQMNTVTLGTCDTTTTPPPEPPPTPPPGPPVVRLVPSFTG